MCWAIQVSDQQFIKLTGQEMMDDSLSRKVADSKKKNKEAYIIHMLDEFLRLFDNASA